MKLSIAWIFDHIKGSWKDYDIAQLVDAFNKTTAEIEEFYPVTLDLSHRCLVRVIEKKNDATVVDCPELGKSMSLPVRKDVIVGNVYMIAKDNDAWRWATTVDLGSCQERILPSLMCSENKISGQWKDDIEVEDYIIDIDNKTITHRPDLWGHRGIAREVAAILDLPFLPIDDVTASYKIKPYEHFAASTQGQPFTFEVKDTEKCKRFAGFYVSDIPYTHSWLWVAHRLSRVDSKPIDGLVDATNYVMLDTSQPLHAFDADTIETKTIMPRMAKKGESLTLLDDETIELAPEDLVITDGKKPIALAGVMGGKETEVTNKTRAVLFEAANFDPISIRKTAQRHKKRTDSSARFEKTLDPNQNTKALRRLIFLLQQEGIPFTACDEIISLGHEEQPLVLDVDHALIEADLGTKVESVFVVKTLEALGFGVKMLEHNNQLVYNVTVPTFRSSKDVKIPADIIEEIARFYGYEKLPASLPEIETKPTDNNAVFRVRNIKEYLAFGMKCREVNNYPLYDAVFLENIGWQPKKLVGIKNPISEHNKYLVTSLIPQLLKDVQENAAQYDSMKFFEWARVWTLEQKNAVLERKRLSGIVYQESELDFYQVKEEINGLFAVLGISVNWKKASPEEPWYHPYKTASIHYGDMQIGLVGMVNPSFFSKIAPGNACIFDIDGDFILSCKPDEKRFKPLPVYQDTHRDVSMFVPIEVEVATLEKTMREADGRIFDVALIDFFQKDEWPDKRSLTMRFYARDPEKTLVKEEIDRIYDAVVKSMKKHKVEIR